MIRNLCPLFVVILLVLLLYQSVIAWDVRAVQKFGSAYSKFLRDSAVNGCVKFEDFRVQAFERNWLVEEYTNQDSFTAAFKPAAFDTALRVYVEPPLSYSKIPGVMFYFDEKNCLLPDKR